MALPSSGQIGLNAVRTETSQSAMINYSLTDSLHAPQYWTSPAYAPINVNGKTGVWTENSPLAFTNQSMSLWYDYNHQSNIEMDVTGTLYNHSIDCYNKTMLIVDIGTTSKLININVSGSIAYASDLIVYYGKPWKHTGASGVSTTSTVVTQSFGITELNYTYTYDYTYDSNYGQYLYFVTIAACV